jgi:hypothetical protein
MSSKKSISHQPSSPASGSGGDDDEDLYADPLLAEEFERRATLLRERREKLAKAAPKFMSSLATFERAAEPVEKPKDSGYYRAFDLDGVHLHLPLDVEEHADNHFLIFLAWLAEKTGREILIDGVNKTGDKEDLKLGPVVKRDERLLAFIKDELISQGEIRSFPKRGSGVDEDSYQARAIVQGQLILSRFGGLGEAQRYFKVLVPVEYSGMAWTSQNACANRQLYKRLTKISTDAGVAFRYFRACASLLKELVAQKSGRVNLMSFIKSPGDILHESLPKKSRTIMKKETITLPDGRSAVADVSKKDIVTLPAKAPWELLGVRQCEKPAMEEAWTSVLGSKAKLISDEASVQEGMKENIDGRVTALSEFAKKCDKFVKANEEARIQCEKILRLRRAYVTGNKGSMSEQAEKWKKFLADRPVFNTDLLPSPPEDDYLFVKGNVPEFFRLIGLLPQEIVTPKGRFPISQVRLECGHPYWQCALPSVAGAFLQEDRVLASKLPKAPAAGSASKP